MYIVTVVLFVCFFFFKQKTAYEMRISDWSSDVCSSDLGVVVTGDAEDGGECEQCGGVADGAGGGRAATAQREHAQRHVHDQQHQLGSEPAVGEQIGRASCRERVCQYV